MLRAESAEERFLKSKKNLLKFFSKNQLISHYTHIGVKSKFLHQNFKKAILGYYNNLAIINPSITLYNLKTITKFLFAILLQNKKLGFLFEELEQTLLLERINIRSHYYILGSWPAGLFTNKIDINTCHRLNTGPNWFPNFPSAIFAFNLNPNRLVGLSLESRKVGIPLFCLVDCTNDLDFLDYWVPTNLKSGKTKLFWLDYLNCLINKAALTRKKLFEGVARSHLSKILFAYSKKNCITSGLEGFGIRDDLQAVFRLKRENKQTALKIFLRKKRNLNWLDAGKVIKIHCNDRLARVISRKLQLTLKKYNSEGKLLKTVQNYRKIIYSKKTKERIHRRIKELRDIRLSLRRRRRRR